MSGAQEYFMTTGDQESRVWVFEDDVLSKFPLRQFSCGNEAFRIQIIDPFAGRHPLLVNHETLSREEVRIPFRPTVILDSNIVAYLHQFVTMQPILDSERRRTVEEFLKYVVRNRLDYNPFFYYMEGASRPGPLSRQSYSAFSESILRLHTMNDEYFLAYGQIRTNPRVLDKYRQEFSVNSFAELAECYAKRMVQPTDVRMEWTSKLGYAALMKAGLIHKTVKRGIIAKYVELRDFMENVFNVALGRERIFALEYFAGGFDEALPIQRGANPERVLNRIRATAWDLQLLQLPEAMLVADTEEGVYLSCIASADKALCKVARAYRVEAVMAWAPKIHVPIPVISCDLSVLSDDIGADVVDQISEMDASWGKSRAARLFAPETRISWNGLDELIGSLEKQVVGFCKS